MLGSTLADHTDALAIDLYNFIAIYATFCTSQFEWQKLAVKTKDRYKTLISYQKPIKYSGYPLPCYH